MPTFGGFRLEDARQEAENLAELGYPVPAEFERAGVFMLPVGPAPAHGWLLMLKENVDQLNLNGLHSLVMTDTAGRRVELHRLVVTSVENLTGGTSPTACYMLEVADARWLCRNPRFTVSINKQYNVRAPGYTKHTTAANRYYASSLNAGALWTWSTLIGDVWATMVGQLDAFPGLPITPHGAPEGWKFPGVSAYDALTRLLFRIGCAIKADLTQQSGQFSIVQIGASDATVDSRIDGLVAQDMRIYDRVPASFPVRGKLPAGVRVFFHRINRDYGSEETTSRETAQFSTAQVHSVDITSSTLSAADVQGNTYHPVWDDLSAEFDVAGAIQNASDVNARAQERTADYYRMWGLWETDWFKAFRGLHDIMPGSSLSGVAWRHSGDALGDGWITEITRHPWPLVDVRDNATWKPLDVHALGIQPPIIGPQYPIYPHLLQIVEIASSTLSSGRFDATVEQLDPDTLTHSDKEECYAVDLGGATTLTVGQRYHGRLSGFVNGKPIYQIRASSGASTSLTITAPLTINNPVPPVNPAPLHILLQHISGSTTLQAVAVGYGAIVYHNNQLKFVTAAGLLCVLCGKTSCKCCTAECAPPSSTFTWINQGNAVAYVNRNGSITLFDPSGSVSPDLHLYQFDLPPTPYLVTLKCLVTFGNHDGKPLFGLTWRESSSGKLHTLYVRSNAAAVIDLNNDSLHPLVMGSQKWGDFSTPDAEYRASSRLSVLPVYLRIQDDGTDRIALYSLDGNEHSWVEYDRQTRDDYLEADKGAVFLDASESQGLAVTICCLDATQYVQQDEGLEIAWESYSVVGPYSNGPEQLVLAWESYSSLGLGPYDLVTSWESYSVVGDYIDDPEALVAAWESIGYVGSLPPPYLRTISGSDPDLDRSITNSGTPPLDPWTSPPFTFNSQTVIWQLTHQVSPCKWILQALTSPGGTVVAQYEVDCSSWTVPDSPTTMDKVSGPSAYPPTVDVDTVAAPTDYFLHLLLDETGGEPYEDDSGNGRDFRNVNDGNPPTSVAGQIGTALEVDCTAATGGLVSDSNYLNSAASWTVKVWVKVTATDAGATLPTFGNNDATFSIFTTGASETFDVNGTSLSVPYTEGQFEMLAYGWDAASGKARISINGGAWQEETKAGGAGNTEILLAVAGLTTGTVVVVDDFAVWNRALSDAEIAAIYDAEN